MEHRSPGARRIRLSSVSSRSAVSARGVAEARGFTVGRRRARRGWTRHRPEPRAERARVTLPDGARATLHIARFELSEWSARVIAFDRPQPLVRRCRSKGARDAIVGGFFLRPAGTRSASCGSGGRGCNRSHSTNVGTASGHAGRRRAPRGVGCAAGPPGADQFDSDITRGRHPRAALALDGSRMLAVACDGRTARDAETRSCSSCADPIAAPAAPVVMASDREQFSLAAVEDDRERERRGRLARATGLERFSWSSVTAAIAETIAEVVVAPAPPLSA
jgi:hypothetical protein